MTGYAKAVFPSSVLNTRAAGRAGRMWTTCVNGTTASAVDARRDSPWAFPWERRQHERMPVDLLARLHGPRGEIVVRALNVSAGGTLLDLTERDLCAVPPLVERSVLHSVAKTLFGAHLEVAFLERGVTVGARLARMVCPPDATERLHLGLRFLELLNPLQLRRLGVNPAETPPPGGGAAGVQALAAGSSTRLTVSLGAFDDGTDVLAAGPLLGIADHAVAFRERKCTSDGMDAGEAVTRLAGRALALRVQEGDGRTPSEPLWSTTAHLITVRVLDGVGAPGATEGGFAPGVELTMLTDVDPGQALGQRLHAAETVA